MNTGIELYLSGSRSTGLLLSGSPGMNLKEEALYVASSLLETDADVYLHPDFLMLECPDGEVMGVDELQPIFIKAGLKPAIAKKMIIVIHRMDCMTVQAQNKLLKILEDNQNVLFIFAVFEEHRVLNTIKSRMRIVRFSPCSMEEFMASNEMASKELFFITGGIPENIGDYQGGELEKIFLEITKTFNVNKFSSIFSILSLLKEKDKNNFYLVYPEQVCSLFRFIGHLLKEKISVLGSRDREEMLPYLKAIEVVSEQLLNYNKKSYQKDSFFWGIVQLVEILELEGGKKL